RQPPEVARVAGGGRREAGPGARRNLGELDRGQRREQARERQRGLERVEDERVAAPLDRDAPPRVKERRAEDQREGGGAHAPTLAGSAQLALRRAGGALRVSGGAFGLGRSSRRNGG